MMARADCRRERREALADSPRRFFKMRRGNRPSDAGASVYHCRHYKIFVPLGGRMLSKLIASRRPSIIVVRAAKHIVRRIL